MRDAHPPSAYSTVPWCIPYFFQKPYTIVFLRLLKTNSPQTFPFARILLERELLHLPCRGKVHV